MYNCNGTNQYYRTNNKLIFFPLFNSSLDDFILNNPDINMQNVNTIYFYENSSRGIFSSFNQPVITNNLFDHVNKFIFGYNFNSPIVLPSKTKYLTLGYCFKQKIALPESLEYLEINIGNVNTCFHILSQLPNGLKTIVFGDYFVCDINGYIPNSVTNIVIKNSRYAYKLTDLPKSLKCLELSVYYQQDITHLVKKMEVIKKMFFATDYMY